MLRAHLLLPLHLRIIFFLDLMISEMCLKFLLGQLDFTATSVQLIFSPIVSVRNISVPITDDSIVESVETFFGTLTSDTDQPVDLNPSQAEISILDNVDRKSDWFIII